MSDNFTITEQLIRYVDNDLDDAERTLLEQQLQQDQALREELEGIKVARQAVRLYGLHQTVAGIHKEAMEEMRSSAPGKVSSIRRITRWSMGVAAAAIIIVAATAGYQYATVSSVKLFNDTYKPYEISQVRGVETAPLKLYYTQNNMQQVIQLFSKQATHTVEDYYLAGNAYLQTNNAPGAIECFKNAQQKNTADNTAIYAEDIEYYLAAAYLQNDDPKQALPLFTAIYNNKQHAYHDRITRWQLTRLGWLANKK